MDATEISQVVEILQTVLAKDNDNRKLAEGKLNELKSQPDKFCSYLISVIRSKSLDHAGSLLFSVRPGTT
jgi:hypothetical protein